MKTDWGEQFDASVGLAFSLRAFEMYRTSGILSAEIRAVPGIRGQCQAFLELIEGKIVSCYLVDRTGKRYLDMKESLIKLDRMKGPFNWTFCEAPASTLATLFREQAGPPSASQAPQFPVPARLVDNLNEHYLQRWTPEQQRCLYLVFSLINGRRGINEIKEQVLLSPVVVDEVIRILLGLHVIVIQ